MFGFLFPRRKLFVSPAIQGRLMSRIALYWVLYHFVLWHGAFAYQAIERGMESDTIAPPLLEQYADFATRNGGILLCAAAMLPVFLVDLLHLTHRIAGPLVRFQSTLRGMTEGENVEPVKIRRGDLLAELEVAFNDYVEVYLRTRQRPVTKLTMNRQEADLIHQIVDLKTTLEGLDGRLTADSPSEKESPVPLPVGLN